MRFTTKAAAFATALVSSAAIAGAQTTVSGTTTGCFGAGCTNFSSTASYAIDNTGASIAFAGNAFTGTTNPVTNGFTVGNFGTLVLNGLSGSTPNTAFSTPFSLMFNLTAPSGASSPSTTFIVSGFVGSTNGMGARDISYTGGSTSFTFDNGGRGTIMVDGGQIGVQATNLSGRVTATASTVPEPSTYAMMGMGLVGMLTAARRRRQA